MENIYDTLITDAFIRLCTKKPLPKITMQDIANESKLARRTIYNHFQDKYAIMQYIYDQRLKEAHEIYDRTCSLMEPVTSYLTVCSYYPNFYKSLISYKGQDDYIQNLVHDLYENTVLIIEHNVGAEYLTEDVLFEIRFYCKAFATHFAEWVLNDMPIPADIFAHRVLKCFPRELRALLDIASENRRTRKSREHLS